MRVSAGYAAMYSLQQTDIGSWMKYLMYKSQDTYQHCVRVALLAEILAPRLGFSEKEEEDFIRGCFLHDLGKVRIPNDILHKKEPLSQREWDVLRRHPLYGEEIMINHSFYHVNIIQLVRFHHERYDGKGYPDGLFGEQIPLFARACAVIDAFDSMLSTRIYRKPLTLGQVKEELCNNRFTQFDGVIVDKLLSTPDEDFTFYFSMSEVKKK